MMMLVFCILLALASASVNVPDLCPGTIPLQRVPSSAQAVWWVIAATRMSSGQCGINNNQPPCECTGFNLTSNLECEYINTYNATLFGYNINTSSYENQKGMFTLVDKTQPWAIFSLIVESSNGEPIVSVYSKDPAGLSEQSQEQVDLVLKKNNINKEKLVKFNTESCPASY